MKRCTRLAIRSLEDASMHLSQAATLIDQATFDAPRRDRASLRKIQLDSGGHSAFLWRVTMLMKWKHNRKGRVQARKASRDIKRKSK